MMHTPLRRALGVATAAANAPLQRALMHWPALRRFDRLIRFGLVGISGIVVNTAILWTLVHRTGLAVPLASMLATEVAIISNFLLNDRWTFRAGARRHGVWLRLLPFNGVALGGMVLTAVLLTTLTNYAGLPLLIANVLAVGGAMIWNYVMNTRWTWRAPAGETAAARPPGRLGD
jgi:dolichol-phosphate mannosyltransferase